MEKFFDIVCRFGKLTPSAAVLVTTVRAIKHHAGLEDDPRAERSAALQAIETGFANVRRHLNTIAAFGVPAVVAVNRRPGDTNEEVELVKRLALETGAFAAEANEGFTKGGAGVADLASAVVEACEQPNTFHQLYQDDEPIQDKIEAVAKQVYGAKDVYFYPEAEGEADAQFTREGHGHFPSMRMAKTHPVAVGGPDAAERAGELQGSAMPVPGTFARTPAQAAAFDAPLRRHHADAGPRQDSGRAQHRHRLRGSDRRPFLIVHLARCWTPLRRGRPRRVAGRARRARARWRLRWCRWQRNSPQTANQRRSEPRSYGRVRSSLPRSSCTPMSRCSRRSGCRSEDPERDMRVQRR